MGRRTIGLAVAAVGVAVLTISMVAAQGDDDVAAERATTPTTRVGPTTTAPSATTTTATTTTSTTTTTPTTTTPTTTSTTTTTPTATTPTTTTPTELPDRAAIEAFFGRWATQVTDGDVDGLVASLHPLVVDLYGRDQCSTTLAGVVGAPVEVEVRSVGDSAESIVELDGVVLDVPGLTVVSLYRSDVDQVVDASVAPRDGTVTWFTDCGSPEAP